jgi:hypothetical protein
VNHLAFQLRLLALIAFLATSLHGCKPVQTGSAKVEASMHGRKYVVVAERNAAVMSNRTNDGVIIQFNKQEAAVAKEQIVIDGKTVVPIPATTLKIEVTAEGGTVTILADGKEVFRSGGQGRE